MIITELTDKKLIKLVHDSGCFELQERIEFNWKDDDGSLADSELDKLIVECEDIIYHFEGDDGWIGAAENEGDYQSAKELKKEYKATQRLLKKLLSLRGE